MNPNITIELESHYEKETIRNVDHVYTEDGIIYVVFAIPEYSTHELYTEEYDALEWEITDVRPTERWNPRFD